MRFIESVFEKLERHPKRIVFPDGCDKRVLAAAAELIERKLGVAILLGKKEEIADICATERLSTNRMLIIDPSTGDDLPLFIKALSALPRYKGIAEAEARKIVSSPNYFGTMMLSHGQADGLVGGAVSTSGALLRPLFQLIKPLPGIKMISSCMVLEVPGSTLGDNGLFVLADCAVIPNPNVEQLAGIAIETAKISRQMTGRVPRVAMLSYSTKGSAQTSDTEKIMAATALAQQYFHEHHLEIEIDGELQVDAALDKNVAAVKAPHSAVAGQANVLVFPDLNSGNISSKLIQSLTSANTYGQILIGLDKPAADLSRGATPQEILGVAAIVGLQAISYRRLYPDQGARFDSPAE